VNPVNNRESKDTLEGNLYIVIFWNMAIDRCGHTVAFERIWKDAHHQDWLRNNAALEGQSHIVIIWNMVIDRWYHTIALNECRKGTHPEDWLWDHLFWRSKTHFIAWIWVIKWTSLMMPLHFFSQSD
jgi:hypothetical protein